METNIKIKPIFKWNAVLIIVFLFTLNGVSGNKNNEFNPTLLELFYKPAKINDLVRKKQYTEVKTMQSVSELLSFAKTVKKGLYHSQIKLSGRMIDIALLKDKYIMFLTYNKNVNLANGFYYMYHNNVYFIDCNHYIDYGNKFISFNHISYINKLNNLFQYKQRIALYNLSVTHKAFSHIDNMTVSVSYIVPKNGDCLKITKETRINDIENYFSYITHPICTYRVGHIKNYEVY